MLVRERAGAPVIAARDAAGPDALARMSSMFLDGDRDAHAVLSTAMGQLGAATAVVQVIGLAEQLRAGRLGARAAIGVHASAPELASVVRVEVSA